MCLPSKFKEFLISSVFAAGCNVHYQIGIQICVYYASNLLSMNFVSFVVNEALFAKHFQILHERLRFAYVLVSCETCAQGNMGHILNLIH